MQANKGRNHRKLKKLSSFKVKPDGNVPKVLQIPIAYVFLICLCKFKSSVFG